MFKIESYITPVILSYVEKYVKNFKPEQSQVSLWGGDASFQNLDLRLEVLEEQLNLPFAFVSGHIHELLIHVPWVKITSEPIVITINTIECILNLKDQRQVERSTTTSQGSGIKAIQEESPPGYIKSIVTKVVNNITINCNNLILKYVEEDIVLSVNVRFLSVQTVNEIWEPTFADVSSSEVTLRKIITVEDLTLCLDKMDTAGKIEIYQDPVLYRCSMIIRLMMNYHSGAAKSASITSFDLHCEKMEFSMTEQQLPMLLRLISLITTLGVKQQPSLRNDRSSFSSDDRGDALQDDDVRTLGTSPDGNGDWGGWAWNVVTSFLPVDWDPDWSEEQQVASTGHTIHMGVYIDEAVLTFKTVETLQEQLFYKSRKIRYNSFVALRVTSAVVTMLVKGSNLSNLQLGLGSIRLQPEGICSCGYHEIADETIEPPIYIEAGTVGNDYLTGSLFDKNFIDNAKWKNRYNDYNIDFHLDTVSVKSMLERGPAFGMDVIHSIEIPDDYPADKIAEFESNFEYSNFPERKVIRYVVGDVKIQLCTGLMHRIETMKSAAKYDYSIYMVGKPEPSFRDLPPVTVEEYEALRENVSIIETHIHLGRLALQFRLTDHGIAGASSSKAATGPQLTSLDLAFSRNAHLSVETSQIEGSIVEPMYPFRLASCASQQTDIAPEMLNDCYTVLNVKISGLQSKLYLNEDCHAMIVMPLNARFNRKSLIFSQYWQQSSVNHDIIELEMDDVTLTGTKAKLMVAMAIPSLILDPIDKSNPLFCSTLFADACNERDPVYLETSLENVSCKRIKSWSTTAIKIDVNSIKAFALNDTQQAFVLSGPEIDVDPQSENTGLFSGILQYSEKFIDDSHPSILSFSVAEIRGSFDPLLLEWLCYRAVYEKPMESRNARRETETPAAVVEDTHSDTDVRRKIFRTLHESVHSSSDKDKRRSNSRTDWSKGVSGVEDLTKKIPINDNSEIEQQDVEKSGILSKIAQLYPLWRKLVLCGSIGHFVVYVPTVTMDGIGVAGVEAAIERASSRYASSHILAIKSPSVIINSSNVQSEKLQRHLKQLPSRLPTWSHDYHGFPWTLRLNNLSCYTREKSGQMDLVSGVDLTATIDVTTKTPTAEISEGAQQQVGLGLCVYIDTLPIMISLTEKQIVAISSIASEMTRVRKIFCRTDVKTEDERCQIEANNFSFDVPKTPSSYNPVVYPENTTSPSSISTARDSPDNAEAENPVITAMIQWTIAKMSLKLYTTDEETGKLMKLLLELEDIISTVDWQPIYLKFKNKITTASICHFVRETEQESWKFGDYDGLIMSVRESSTEQSDDAGFFAVTYTRAQSGNVHTRWGAQKHHKSQKIRANRDCALSAEGYITEIDMSLRRMDVTLPPSIIGKFVLLLKPFFSTETNKTEAETTQPFLRCDNFENKSLPLVYLEFKGMNLMVPTRSGVRQKLYHNLLMIQLDGVSITPSTENPICRTILRSDIYQLAAQSNILNIPGSSVEDRQYQVNVRGICACTTTWKNYEKNVAKRISQPYLYTMNENPALEWNNLANENNSEPRFSTSLLMSRVDVRIIIAPAVVLHPSKIICGGAFELTCLTDIDVAINVDQMKLLWRIYAETNNFTRDLQNFGEKVSSAGTKASSSMIFVGSTQEIEANRTSKDNEPDLTGDSGIDFESSSVNYAATRKIPKNGTFAPVPLEILVNCGSVSVSFHAMTTTSADDTTAEENQEANNEFPFLYVTLIEPNLYISRLNEKEKIQVSCFDVAVSLRNSSNSSSSANIDVNSIVEKSKLPLIETKSGNPHPITGIPPSFVIVKCEKNNTSSAELSIDVGRPTRLNCSMIIVKYIDRMRNEIEGCFVDREDKIALTRINEKPRTNKIEGERDGFDIPELSFKSEQLVLRLTTRTGSDVSISVAKSSGSVSGTVKFVKIHGNIGLDSVVVSARSENDTKILLKPTSLRIAADVFWEIWQDYDDEPRIKIQAYSQGVFIEFGPRQMNMLNSIAEEYYELVNYLHPVTILDNEIVENRSSSAAEQYYKDDLKAGAFQFVDGKNGDVPTPYQVVFYTYPERIMAWKYPQPRIITGLHVSPIPFGVSILNLMSDGEYDDDYDEDSPITCTLEYWSESHASYKNYVEFHLSETDSSRPEIPNTPTTRAIASIWRVVVSSRNERRSIAPQLLAGCLRIDSYFNASTIPRVQIAMNIARTEISLTNHVTASIHDNLPGKLANFRPSGFIPEVQCFARLIHDETSIVIDRWSNSSVLIDVTGNFKLDVLDYGLLVMRELIDRLESNVQISISDEKTTNVRIECLPCTIKFSPSISHTIAVSSNLWLGKRESEINAVVPTRLIVANDSNVIVRFGQFGANDDVALKSRECHFYCWPLANNRTLRFALDDNAWSLPLSVDKNDKQLVIFDNRSNSPVICASIASISATQKLVTISGLLVLTNRLAESFHMRLVRHEINRGENETMISQPLSDDVYTINGNDKPSTIALPNIVNVAMRLRFVTLKNSSWTGDIPLGMNSKLGQPWLVKVPLQDRGQFMSIWVRIVEENIYGQTRMLVVMSPLYMIKSYLPVPVVIKIETPSLGMSSTATIEGRGKIQQLYCPGTFEHCHQLTFHFESSMSASNPYVPLSYSSIEEKTFFSRPKNEDIDEILTELEKEERISYLPFQGENSNLKISADQPQTHVQIKYGDAGLVSSTLLLELQPWCFIFNTLGCEIAIIAEDIELCKIAHNGIVTPPKLEGTFHLRVTMENMEYVSPALQLARPDWNPGFYMPRIRGLVPVDGNIQASIECGSNLCVITMNSRMHKDMKIVRIMPSHVICNFTSHEIRVACLAVSETSAKVQFPGENFMQIFSISPSKHRSQGIPIIQWRIVDKDDIIEHEALYVALSLESSWSCPIRVDGKCTARRCVAIANDFDAIPLVVTIQEDEGTTYILIHIDDHPQLYIENLCSFPILLGESISDGNGICDEAMHFSWIFRAEPGKSCYYSTPSTVNKTPDSQTMEHLPRLRLSAPSMKSEEEITVDEINSKWSRPISMSQVTNRRTEQGVRLPIHGDIKLLMEKRCHTIHLRIVCISQVQVSAHEIRTRLIHEENKSFDSRNAQSRLSDDRNEDEITGRQSDATSSSIQRYSHCDKDGKIDEEFSSRTKSLMTSDGSKALRGSLTVYVRGINLVIMRETNDSARNNELASLSLSDLLIVIASNDRWLTLEACIGDLQLDNQLYDDGGFDFPVVFVSQHPYTRRGARYATRSGNTSRMERIKNESLLVVDCAWEVNVSIYACNKVDVKIGPISAYIEDTFVTQLLEYTSSTSPNCFNVSTVNNDDSSCIELFLNGVSIPDNIIFESANLRNPLRIEKLTIHPISVLLSVHTSIRLYVALDHSPLYFGAFEREHLLTNPSGLANSLTMHYLSGALFGAGWVVGSLEILGSPGGFAQALGSGLKDFVTLPIQGLLRGPWSFLIGVTQGSASLMKHVTAGTVNSVTRLASSVARNLDRLTLDNEHLQRQEESRRTRPQGMAQGLYQGLTGFGMSLLAAVAGLAHHPLQQVLSGVATPRGLVTGVGLGIVGAVTKPLSGAAELVALTGQGLLEGTGWNPLPTPRQRPTNESPNGFDDSTLKCVWRMLPALTKKTGSILHVAHATCSISGENVRRVALIVTRRTLLIANCDDGKVDKIYLLRELTSAEHTTDGTILCLYCLQTQDPPERSTSPIEYPEMDRAMRVRVEQFVRGSNTSFSSNGYQQPETMERLLETNPSNVLTFHVESAERNYFLSMFHAAKLQDQGNYFVVL